MTRYCAALLLLVIFCASPAAPQSPSITFEPRYWATLPYGDLPPLFADMDGDGYTDTLTYHKANQGSLIFTRTNHQGKPEFPKLVMKGIEGEVVGMGAGNFQQTGRAEVVCVLRDGSVRYIHEFDNDAREFRKNDTVAKLPITPKANLQLLIKDYTGDKKPDILIVSSDGTPYLLRNDLNADGTLRFSLLLATGKIPTFQRIVAGRFDAERSAKLVWLANNGKLHIAEIKVQQNTLKLITADMGLRVSPGSHLSVGHFTSKQYDDLMVGNQLLVGGKPTRLRTLPTLPTLPKNSDANSDLLWNAGDLDSDGFDDLIRVRSLPSVEGHLDIVVYFRHLREDWRLDGANDGLLLAWKMGKSLAGGLDLRAMGCKPGRRDVILEIQRAEDVDQAEVEEAVKRCIKYFANLPIENPDGSRGIAVHPIYLKPVTSEEKSISWLKLAERYHLPERRGITHWMYVHSGGGGQSLDLADRGSCGVKSLYATLLHELGHHFGLTHTAGGKVAWSPLYPSLMNYAFNYQLNGSAEGIGFSTGDLHKAVVNETQLTEVLPFPITKLRYLANAPYFYDLKPSTDGTQTLIDWNRNGKLGEKGVVADINWGYATQAGTKHGIAQTTAAPVLATLPTATGERLLLFYVEASNDSSKIGRMVVRYWQGNDPKTDGKRWTSPMEVDSKPIGDPSAVRIGTKVWLSYPTEQGVVIRWVQVNEAGQIVLGKEQAIPDSQSAQVTLARWEDRLVLFLWRNATTSVGYRVLEVERTDSTLSTERKLGLVSNAPIGAVVGAETAEGEVLWVGASQTAYPERASRWQLRRFRWKPDKNLEEVSREWIGGDENKGWGNGRLVLLYEPNPELGSMGQVHILGQGIASDNSGAASFIISNRIGNRQSNGGWLSRNYYDEWTKSLSAPGVALFGGEMIFAGRQFEPHGEKANNNLYVGFYGRGIESEAMSDFDDIGYIANIGLLRSIRFVSDIKIAKE